MKRTVNSVHSPKWANAEHTMIDMMVDFDELDEEFVPFTAYLYDVEQHGVDLFIRASTLEFGPVAEYVPPPVTVKDYEREVQNTLDAKARERGYDNILSACSYASVANPFQAESIAFVEWRAACWSYCYDQLAQVESGAIPQPTVAELVAGLPAFGG